jgi:hypothetical protein
MAPSAEKRLVMALRIRILMALIAASACRQSDQNAAISRSASSSGSSTESAPRNVEPNPHAGPQLISDSTLMDPRLEISGDQYVLHVPADMAHALYDSLPGFTPIQQSTYPSDVAAKHKSPLSVAVGDFNGDSRQDIIMVGRSQNTPVFLMLLGKSEQIKQPRLIVISRPAAGTPTDIDSHYLELIGPRRIKNPDDSTSFFELRTDGVLVQNARDEKIYAIYFWNHGEVLQYSIGGD